MNNRFSEELFLTNPTGSMLYHKYAEHMPIIDYHCHLQPAEILENREFEDLDYNPRRRPMMPDLRIFTVVDTDDSPHDVQAYVTGNLLRSCPLSDSIVPIFNTPNLDAVFESHGFLVDRRNKAGSYKAISRRLDFLELYRLLKEDDSTNLDVFIRHVLSKVPELQNKVDPGIV